MFSSRESSVRQWEHGYCIPRLIKLMNISMYFGVSLDCILCGRPVNDSLLELHLSGADENQDILPPIKKLISKFNALSDSRKERILGYLDALSRESLM